MKHTFTFEDLFCYRLAVQTDQWLVETRFPPGRSHLRDRAIRACDSIVINLAGGWIPLRHGLRMAAPRPRQ